MNLCSKYGSFSVTKKLLTLNELHPSNPTDGKWSISETFNKKFLKINKQHSLSITGQRNTTPSHKTLKQMRRMRLLIPTTGYIYYI